MSWLHLASLGVVLQFGDGDAPMPTTPAHGCQLAFSHQFADSFIGRADHSPSFPIVHDQRLTSLVRNNLLDQRLYLRPNGRQELLHKFLREHATAPRTGIPSLAVWRPLRRYLQCRSCHGVGALRRSTSNSAPLVFTLYGAFDQRLPPILDNGARSNRHPALNRRSAAPAHALR